MSDAFPDRNHRLLVELLAGDRDLYRLYAESPEFHAALDVVVGALPAVVGLIAENARKSAAARKLALRALYVDYALAPGVLADLMEGLRGPDA